MPSLPRRWCPALLGTLIPLVFNPAVAAPDPLPGEQPGQTPAGTVLVSKTILHELKSFREMGTVLHVGAHPDDENTELITWLSRGRGYRTGYLSMTRGDGGQNELGPEFGEKLGVARTQELLAARRLDGGRQFFTRAIDFGFSKTPEETLRFWNHDQVLADVVRVIRRFRPDVIITRFPIPPGSGGHGQHTASAILAVQAFKLAADPTAFPEQLTQGLTVWQAKRVLWNSFRFGNAPQPLNGPTFPADIAGTDDVTGESFGAIAARSRAMHKTQGLGGFTSRVGHGPNLQTFMLLAGDAAEKDLMDGVDTTWARVPGGAEIAPLVDAAIARFNPDKPADSVPAILAIRARLAVLPANPLVTDKRAQLDRILQRCAGLEVATFAVKPEVVPGETMFAYTPEIRAQIPVQWVRTQAWDHPTAQAARKGSSLAVGPGTILHTEFFATIPADIPISQPYWLRKEGTAGVYHVDDPALIGLPEAPSPFQIRYSFELGGQTLVVTDVPSFVTKDETGEHRRPVVVVPPVSLAFNAEVYIVPPGTTKEVTIEVTAARAGTGVLRLESPEGWKVRPAPQDFHFANAGDKARVSFSVTAPASPSSGHLMAVAKIDGREYSNERYEINYRHIPVQLLQPPARIRVASFPLATRGFTIGYIPGAGDSVAECLGQMGFVVRRLGGADLTPENLLGLDAVVLGVRAFNENDELAAHLPGLWAYVENGGTVIAQYNRPDRPLKSSQLGPYELSIKGPVPQLRVTDEDAPVSLLAPDAAALNAPNKISAADFEGWVQERGTYFPSKWDEAHYTALLAMSDPGEAPLRSSVLVAHYGKGYYVYTGLAFFRQLPAGVPGAYRLFANLLSLGK